MGNFKLGLEDLEVESFSTHPTDSRSGGTVKGNLVAPGDGGGSELCEFDSAVYTCEYTCQNTCRNTCGSGCADPPTAGGAACTGGCYSEDYGCSPNIGGGGGGGIGGGGGGTYFASQAC